jgi:hypothetical protein
MSTRCACESCPLPAYSVPCIHHNTPGIPAAGHGSQQGSFAMPRHSHCHGPLFNTLVGGSSAPPRAPLLGGICKPSTHLAGRRALTAGELPDDGPHCFPVAGRPTHALGAVSPPMMIRDNKYGTASNKAARSRRPSSDQAPFSLKEATCEQLVQALPRVGSATPKNGHTLHARHHSAPTMATRRSRQH